MIIELTESEIRKIRFALQIARDRANARSIEVSELDEEKGWITMSERYSEIDEKLKHYQSLFNK